jgi:predicted Zn finger-like uncharacterized protein
MIIACDCGARLKISDDKLTDAGVRVKCPKCRTVHLAARSRSGAADLPFDASPRQQPAMPRYAPPSTASPMPERRSSVILVAHDSKAVYDMIDGVLRQAGMASKHAEDGLEALKLATQMRPQAMVVDVGLTGIYGFELCERLKGDADTKGIKIVLLSSVYGLTAYKRSPVHLYGADDYIEKHHIPDELVPKLQRLLRGEAGSAEGDTSDAAPSATTADMRRDRLLAQMPVAIDQDLSLPADLKGLEIPEAPSILPKTPVTLASSRKRTGVVSSSARPADASHASAEPLTGPVPAEMPAPLSPVPEPPDPAAVQNRLASSELRQPSPPDASVRLNASFLEHEEYETPAGEALQETPDPAEIEKAKRCARLIVSDIVLYNQETVSEGIRRGTFYDLLKDDIAEGRAVYDQRVPIAVRKHHDYLQEAFDDFLLTQKKPR